MFECDRKMGRQDVIGASLVGVYLVMLMVVLIPAAFQLWPEQMSQGATGAANGVSTPKPAETEAAGTTKPAAVSAAGTERPTGKSDAKPRQVATVHLPLRLGSIDVPQHCQMTLLVAIAGAIGGLLHALKSFSWYVGNRALYLSWVPSYIFLPVTGGLLGWGTCMLVCGGLMTVQSGGDHSEPLYLPGLAFLVGLFTPQTLEKLKQIAETAFSAPPPGRDTVKPPQGFTVSATPTEQSTTSGNSVNYRVTVKSADGFTSPVALSVSGLPQGAQLPTFSSVQLTPSAAGEHSVLTVPTTGIPAGPRDLTITGTSADKTSKTVVKLIVEDGA